MTQQSALSGWWMIPLSISFLALCLPARTEASTSPSWPSMAVSDSQNTALLEQKRLLTTANKLQSALTLHQHVQAARQIHALRSGMKKLEQRQTQPSYKNLSKSGHAYTGSRVLALKRRSGMAGDLLLLPLNQEEWHASAIDLLWTIHGIEPQNITYASVRYLRQNPSPSSLLIHLNKIDEALQKGWYSEARAALRVLQEKLVETEDTHHVPTRLQASDQLTLASLLIDHQNYDVAETLLETAHILLSLPQKASGQQTAALSDEEGVQHLQDQLSELTRQLNQPIIITPPLPTAPLLEASTAQIDS